MYHDRKKRRLLILSGISVFGMVTCRVCAFCAPPDSNIGSRQQYTFGTRQATPLATPTVRLKAKNTNNDRRFPPQSTKRTSKSNAASHVANYHLPLPALKKHTISLEPTIFTKSPLSIVAYQIEDRTWWQEQSTMNEATKNPYGARLWPSALAVAQFMNSMVGCNVTKNQNDCATTKRSLHDYYVLELGCGGGICSIAAATLGATVVALDVSDTVLNMTQQGWMATQRRLAVKDDKEGIDIQQRTTPTLGILTTLKMDLFSKQSLPIPLTQPVSLSSRNVTTQPITTTSSNSCKQQLLVVAAAMLYTSELAVMLAQRVYDAVEQHNAWIIVGDDDSGEREGGRHVFFQELDRLTKNNNQNGSGNIKRHVSNFTVQNEGLKWRNKQVTLIHLNAPDHARM